MNSRPCVAIAALHNGTSVGADFKIHGLVFGEDIIKAEINIGLIDAPVGVRDLCTKNVSGRPTTKNNYCPEETYDIDEPHIGLHLPLNECQKISYEST